MFRSALIEKIAGYAGINLRPEVVLIKLENVTLELSISTDVLQKETIVGIEFRDDKHCSLFISQHVPFELEGLIAARIFSLFPILDFYYANQTDGRQAGFVYADVGDGMEWSGLSFCGRSNKSFLLPDATFLETKGYRQTAAAIEKTAPPWANRIPIAVWRGTTTGIRTSNWRDLPRIRLCEIGANYSELIDSGITSLCQGYQTFEDEFKALGYMRDHIPANQFARWKYQIDIDGNTNSWPGLFQKLLTGSPVIKIASQFRQWYYDRLVPWENYVPCEENMDDLPSKIKWLREHDDEAREIGRRGRELALSITYDDELRKTADTIAMSLNAQMRYAHIHEAEFTKARMYTSHDKVLVLDPELNKLLQVYPPLVNISANFIPLVVVDTVEGLRLKTVDGKELARIGQDGCATIVSGKALTDSNIAIECVHDDSKLGYRFKIDGKYFCAECDGSLTPSRDSGGPWETFWQM